jgi:predicted ATPase/DNA-binding CsgD family transcriptional regulator
MPTGTVTFVACGVEATTPGHDQTIESGADEVVGDLELVDAAISRHRGIRPAGDCDRDRVVGVFSRPSDALAAALDAQLAYAARAQCDGTAPLVRMAVHTGEAHLRDKGSYFGDALDRCGRILSVSHAGQVLISAAATEVVAGRLPGESTLLDLGVHRLTDLGPREHLWQLAHADLPREFPPLRSLDAFRHNLPSQLTPLVGRHRDVNELAELMTRERLVTLTGSAGVGKTRLALAVAAEVLDRFEGGVWWVELAALSDPEAIGRSAVVAVGGREGFGGTATSQITAALGKAAAVVVLDNCEHLVGACAQFIANLLASSASVSVLTTSREPLGVPGELTWRVPSLACPNPDQAADLSSLSRYDAVVLFVDRARRARPSFMISEANALAIAQICHRLDGIPLAIELAAARCRQLSVEGISAELDDRFRLLTGGARTGLRRQQTLAASIDWSYERLEAEEQLVFRRLGVFNGAFPLEAAESVVVTPGGLALEQVFEVVSRLVDKSLVVAGEGAGGEPRYRLLETLRAYALDRAVVAGELTTLRDAHAAWWLDWLEPSFAMPTDLVLRQVEEFHDNLTAALDWAVSDPPFGLRLLAPLARAWEQIGRYGDAFPVADVLLAPANARHHTSAWLRAADPASNLYLSVCGPEQWRALLDHIEAVATADGDEYHLALACLHRGDLEKATQVADLAHERGDDYTWLRATIVAAFTLTENDPAASDRQLAAAKELVDARGNRDLREQMLAVEAMSARCTGDLRRCLELGRQVIDNPAFANITYVLSPASFAALLARDADALHSVAECARLLQDRAPGATTFTHTAIHRLGLFEGGPSEVSPILGATRSDVPITFSTLWLECREAIDAGSPAVALDGARTHTRPVPHGRAVLAAVEAAATGNEHRWHDALELALNHELRLIAVDALEGLGAASSREESWSESIRLLASAERLRDETGYRWRFSFEQHAVDAAREQAHDALGDAATHAAEAEGASLDWRQAVEYARRARGERKRPHHGWASLTPTELRVVALVAEGLTNPQIAERLFMSRSTVKSHVEHIFAKLGVRRRSELAAAATARQLTR